VKKELYQFSIVFLALWNVVHNCSPMYVCCSRVFRPICARACGSGSQCRPNECIFGSGEPRGVGILDKGVYEPGEGNGEVSLRATWEQGGQILSQQGGFQVRREGWKGEQKGVSKGRKKQGECACIYGSQVTSRTAFNM
jgi:hypothetical protein